MNWLIRVWGDSELGDGNKLRTYYLYRRYVGKRVVLCIKVMQNMDIGNTIKYSQRFVWLTVDTCRCTRPTALESRTCFL